MKREKRQSESVSEGGRKARFSPRALALVSALFFLVSSVAVSFAWFRFGYTSGNIGLTGGGDAQSQVTLRIASWTETTDESTDSASESGSYQWEEEVPMSATNEDTAAGFGTAYSAETPKLHFGSIENLAMRDESNILWFCLKIDRRTGTGFNGLRLAFDATATAENEYPAVDAYPFVLFGYTAEQTAGDASERTEISPDNADGDNADGQNAYHAIWNQLENLLKYDNMLISTTGPGETGDTFAVAPSAYPEDAAPRPNDDPEDESGVMSVRTARDADGNDRNEGFSWNETQAGETGDGEFWYVYFRAYPNIGQNVNPTESYAGIVADISRYMPCVLEYKLQVDISLTNIGYQSSATTGA